MGDGRWWDEDQSCWRDDRGKRVRGLPRPGRERHAQPLLLLHGEHPSAACRPTRVVLASAISTTTRATT